MKQSEAYEVYLKLENKPAQIISLFNLGTIYYNKAEYLLSLHYYQKSLGLLKLSVTRSQPIFYF